MGSDYLGDDNLRTNEKWDDGIGSNRSISTSRKIGVWAFALMSMIGVVAVGVPTLTRDSSAAASQQDRTEHSRRSVPSAKELEEADALLRDQMANGWVPYSSESAIDGKAVAGWVRIGTSPSGLGPDLALMRSEASPTGDGMAVYSQPNGVRTGFDYTSLGFVPNGAVDAGFDSSKARVERYGCDPVSGPEAAECFRSIKPE